MSSRFLTSSELDPSLNGLTRQGEIRIEQIVEDVIGGGVVGTVSSVNDISPDSTGNVSIGIVNMQDVTISGSINDDSLLAFNSSTNSYRNVDRTAYISQPMGEISDYDVSPPLTNNQLIVYKTGTSNYVNQSIAQTLRETVLTNSGDLLTNVSGFLFTLPIGTSGRVLTSNGTTISWQPSASGASSLDQLTDVVITTPQTAEYLQFNGTEWVNLRGFLSDLADVSLLLLINEDDILSYNDGTNQWNSKSISTILKNRLLTGNGDILYTTPSGFVSRLPVGDINQVLTVSAANTISWEDPIIGSQTLQTLDDVDLSSPANENTLIYNTTTSSWINSNQLSVVRTLAATHTTQISNLQASNLSRTINGPITSVSLAYDQVTYPVCRATSLSNSPLVPLDDSGNNALLNPSFVGGVNWINLNSSFSGLTNAQINSKLWAGPTYYPTVTDPGASYVQSPVSDYRINYSFRNNPLTPGNYTLYSYSSNFNVSPSVTFFMLKNQSLATSEVTSQITPTVGSNWDSFSLTTSPGVNTVYQSNIITTQTYYLVAVKWANNARISFATILQAQNLTTDQVIPTNITMTNTTGVLTLNNVVQDNSESWALSISNAYTYYLSQFVCPVIRTTNQLNLLNTQYSDVSIRCSNAFNNFNIQNATATETWLQSSAAGLSINGRLLNLTSGVTPSNNAVLQWSTSNNRFDPVVLTSSTLLSGLGDTSISGVSSNQILRYSGSAWTNSNLSIITNSIDFNSNPYQRMAISGASQGNVLSYTSAGNWTNVTPSTMFSNAGTSFNNLGLANLGVLSPSDGQILRYQSGSWQASSTAPSPSFPLPATAITTISTPPYSFSSNLTSGMGMTSFNEMFFSIGGSAFLVMNSNSPSTTTHNAVVLRYPNIQHGNLRYYNVSNSSGTTAFTANQWTQIQFPATPTLTVNASSFNFSSNGLTKIVNPTLFYEVSASITFRYTRAILVTGDLIEIALFYNFGSTFIHADILECDQNRIYTASIPATILQMSNGANLDLRVRSNQNNSVITPLAICIQATYAGY